MKFGLLYEIPIARPWTRGQRHQTSSIRPRSTTGYKIPHEAVMRSIGLMGKHGIPELDRD